MEQQDLEIKVGSEIINLLNLKPLKSNKDRYCTTWGDKTIQGIGACVLRIVEETISEQ